MSLTEKQLASLDRSARRAVARRGDGGEKLSLFIRVAESRIYNGKPVYKALLKEVIYLRMTDLHENDQRIPKGTPYKDYEGWCYARQEYLANRVGCKHKYANQVLGEIVEDGYLRTRKYRGGDGAWHKQYFPDESFIDAKIAELESSAPSSASADKSDGLLSRLSGMAYPDNQDSPIQIKESGLSRLTGEPIQIIRTKEGSSSSFKGDLEVRSLRTPPSASPSGTVVASLPPASQGKSKPRGATPPEPPARGVVTTKDINRILEEESTMKACPSCGRTIGADLLMCGECRRQRTKAAAAPVGRGFDIEEAD